MITLSKERVLILHENLIEATEGSAGICDERMLDSALSNHLKEKSYIRVFRQKQHSFVLGVVKNHSRGEGNKRLGTHVMLERFLSSVRTHL